MIVLKSSSVSYKLTDDNLTVLLMMMNSESVRNSVTATKPLQRKITKRLSRGNKQEQIHRIFNVLNLLVATSINKNTSNISISVVVVIAL